LKDFIKTGRGGHTAMAYVAPRGIGPDAWNPNERKQVQIRRRFMLLGQTRDGMRVWDVRRAIQAVRTLEAIKKAKLGLFGNQGTSGVTLTASLLEPEIDSVQLQHFSPTLRDGPILLNARRFLNVPQILAMAMERSRTALRLTDNSGWDYPQAVARNLGWDERRLEFPPSGTGECN